MTWLYCTKEDVSDHTGVSVDRLKDSWSEEVEDLINEHVGFSFSEIASYTEAIDGDGSDTIFLSNYPVLSVESLSVGGVQMSVGGYEFYRDGHIRLVHSEGTPIARSMGDGASFPVGQKNIEVTYRAGTSEVPGRVKLAASMMIAQISLVRERAGSDGSFAVSMAGGRQAGERDRSLYGTDISGKLRHIMRTILGEKWNFA